MKRILSIMLSMFILVGTIGCSARDTLKTDENSSNEKFVDRSQESTVYGTENPPVENSMLSDKSIAVEKSQVLSATTDQEIRAVWMSFLTLEPMVNGKTEAQFTANIDKAFTNVENTGFNTIYVHVRPYGDAFYKSQYFPWSRFLTGTEGKNPGYDPLKIMCELADNHNLRIEAWINPYRVRVDDKPMCASNQAKKWLAKGNDAAIQWKGGVYYNPGSQQARTLIINGVKEIVNNYDVDGIHFDDYFYPTTDMSFDAKTYKNSGSKLSQADWRRENVNKLVKQVYAEIKKIDKDCLFGISPQGNMGNNYNSLYADCEKWVSTPGYVDYICPQIYFGYYNTICPYEKTVQDWNDLIRIDGIDMYVGIAPYRLGNKDAKADGGQNEWRDTDNLMSRMVKTARKCSNYGGIAAYSYESLFLTNTEQVKAELENLEELFS